MPASSASKKYDSETPHIPIVPTLLHLNITRWIGTAKRARYRRHTAAKLLKSCTGSVANPAVITARNTIKTQTGIPATSNTIFVLE
jgi:hypothetical protein